jgi:hypothetical protein
MYSRATCSHVIGWLVIRRIMGSHFQKYNPAPRRIYTKNSMQSSGPVRYCTVGTVRFAIKNGAEI